MSDPTEQYADMMHAMEMMEQSRPKKYEPYRLDSEKERILHARECAVRIIEIKRELQPHNLANDPEKADILNLEYQNKIRELGVDVGRALGILPEYLSDDTLAKEANLFSGDGIEKDYKIVLNVYGDVYLTINLQPYSYDGLKDRICLEVAMCKQGTESALRVNTTIGITEDGVAVFEANRKQGLGGTVDGMMTIIKGREVVHVSHVPEQGVFVAGANVYTDPSRTTEVVSPEFRQISWLGIYPAATDHYQYSPIPFSEKAQGKFIDFERVVNFMREKGFDGKTDIPDDLSVQAKLIESFLR